MESIVLEKARPPDGPSWQARASCLGDVCVLSAQSSDADGGDLPHCPGPCGQLCLLSAPPVHFLREGMHGGRLRASCNPQGPRMGAPRLPYQVAKEASERGVREKGRSGETVGTLLRLFHPRRPLCRNHQPPLPDEGAELRDVKCLPKATQPGRGWI